MLHKFTSQVNEIVLTKIELQVPKECFIKFELRWSKFILALLLKGSPILVFSLLFSVRRHGSTFGETWFKVIYQVGTFTSLRAVWIIIVCMDEAQPDVIKSCTGKLRSHLAFNNGREVAHSLFSEGEISGWFNSGSFSKLAYFATKLQEENYESTRTICLWEQAVYHA
jgi:hypothetical protein